MNHLTEDRVREILRKFYRLEASETKSRLGRLLALDSIRTVEIDAGIQPEPADSIDPFVREAAEAYVHGLYRSCIFCCATAAHQILMEALTRKRGYDIRVVVNLQRMRFEQVVGEARNVSGLQMISENADWLRMVRNKIAAHSCYVITGRARSQEQIQFEIETMIRDARALIGLLEPVDKMTVESSTWTYEGKTITFRQALETKDHHGTEVVWYLLQRHVIPVLALEAYRRLYDIMRQLQVYVTVRYHTRASYETGEPA